MTVRRSYHEREHAFEDGGYLESGPSLENRIQEEEYQDNNFVQEHAYQSDYNSNGNDIIEEDDEEALSARVERRSWQRPRYTLSTIYENSLSRLEADDHSFNKNGHFHGETDGDELSSEARSIGKESANKENWGFLEPEIIGSSHKSGRKEESYLDSDSKSGSRTRNFNSANKNSDSKDNDLVYVGSTPSKSRKILTVIDAQDGQHQTSGKKSGLKLEF